MRGHWENLLTPPAPPPSPSRPKLSCLMSPSRHQPVVVGPRGQGVIPLTPSSQGPPLSLPCQVSLPQFINCWGWPHWKGLGQGHREAFLYCGGCRNFNPNHCPHRRAGGTGCGPGSQGCLWSCGARPGYGESGPSSGHRSRSAQSPGRPPVPCRRGDRRVETPAIHKASAPFISPSTLRLGSDCSQLLPSALLRPSLIPLRTQEFKPCPPPSDPGVQALSPLLPQTQGSRPPGSSSSSDPGVHPPALLHTLTRTTATSLWSWSPPPSPCWAPGSKDYSPASVGGSGILWALLAAVLGGTRGQHGWAGT